MSPAGVPRGSAAVDGEGRTEGDEEGAAWAAPQARPDLGWARHSTGQAGSAGIMHCWESSTMLAKSPSTIVEQPWRRRFSADLTPQPPSPWPHLSPQIPACEFPQILRVPPA